ncbi:transmembrane protein 107 like isoform X3 [Ictalurus furcatus]|uniref:transmembrane protein 107 like isoform X3 n=1 Tax=Ictalurus furcatus TaxID=66913 RepID=UPI00234FC86D|nr:transmembrane protein 107 like isoform X3 [Ictalurus furcatus]
MWAISSLVPARFLTLITHLVIVITIFWSRENSVKACLPLTYTVEEYNIEDVRLVVALSVTLGLFAIELAGFFSGASMFNNNQGLLCILTCNVIISIHTGFQKGLLSSHRQLFSLHFDLSFLTTNAVFADFYQSNRTHLVNIQLQRVMQAALLHCFSFCLSSGLAASTGGSLASAGSGCLQCLVVRREGSQ